MGLGDFLGGLIGSHTDEVKPLVTAQTINPNGQILGNQNNYVQSLQNQAAGNGPSAAAMMLKTAQDNAAGNASSMAAGRRGVNPAMALRQAQYAMAGSNQGAANAAAQARVGEQLGAQGMLGSQLNTMQGQSLGAQQANQNAAMQANQINAGIAMDNTKTNNQVTGGVLNGISSGLGAMASFLAKGGFVHPKYMASGGFSAMGTSGKEVNPYADSFSIKMPGSTSGAGQVSATQGYGLGSEALAGGPMDAAGGGSALSELAPLAMMASKGGQVPGKASVKGDSKKNDVVPTMLSPDELVIPRSVSTSKEFIKKLEAIVSDMPGKGPQGFSKVLAARKGRA